jgi:hypothetical protein
MWLSHRHKLRAYHALTNASPLLVLRYLYFETPLKAV